MMNIQDERKAFEATQNTKILFERIEYLAGINAYMPKPEFANQLLIMQTAERFNFGWSMWQACALRAAEKLEGCVVVPVEMPDSFDDALYMYSNDISVVNSEGDGFIPMADLDHGKVWQLVLEAARGGNE